MDMEISPQSRRILAIQRFAPTRWRIRLLGTSNRKYPRKKMPAPTPYTCSLKPRSPLICNLANPTFTRSMKATKYSRNRKGMSLRATLR